MVTDLWKFKFYSGFQFERIGKNVFESRRVLSKGTQKILDGFREVGTHRNDRENWQIVLRELITRD